MPPLLQHWTCTTHDRPWQPSPAKPDPAPEGHPLALTGERDQTWEGAGGCFNELGWLALSELPAPRRDQILRALFHPEDGCHFNLCRVPVGASDYAASWYSLNQTAGDLAMEQFSIERDRACLIPYVRAARELQPDLTLFASPWSPPAWMKLPPVYNHGRLIRSPEILDAYALYFVRFVQAWNAEGVPVHQVHPQNEPAADQKFPSCLWSGAELRDFIRDHLGPAFRVHDVPAEIWLGTINSADYDEFVAPTLFDDEARAFVAGVGFQWDGKAAVQRTHEAFPALRLMQTENECGDGGNSWSYAHYVFGLVRHYITNGAAAYAYWNMILPPGGRSTWGWAQNAMITADPATGTFRCNPDYYVMKHLARTLRPGAVRLGLSGPWAPHAVAFEDTAGHTAVLLENPFPTPRRLAWHGPGEPWSIPLPPRSFHSLLIS
jgi:glucosylceramidase